MDPETSHLRLVQVQYPCLHHEELCDEIPFQEGLPAIRNSVSVTAIRFTSNCRTKLALKFIEEVLKVQQYMMKGNDFKTDHQNSSQAEGEGCNIFSNIETYELGSVTESRILGYSRFNA